MATTKYEADQDDPPPMSKVQTPPMPTAASTERANAADGFVSYGAQSGGRFIDWPELWRYRELAWIFGMRDLQVRYRQTAIGVAWALVQPLTNMVIFLALFGLLGRQPASQDVPYGLVVLCGLVPWQLFTGIVNLSANCLVTNNQIVTKVYFPRLLLPLATVIPALVDFAVGLCLIVGMLFWHRTAPGVSALSLPLFVALGLASALAIGIWLAALNVMYRDVGILVPFLLQIGFFASPVIYQTQALIPERWRLVAALNPIGTVIDGFRWAVLQQPAPTLAQTSISLTVLAVLLLTGLWYFRRVERILADRI